MIIPIFINCEDLPDFDYFEGFGLYFLAYIITYIGMAPLTYSIFGVIYGFDAWGLLWLSVIIGLWVSLIVLILCEIVFDKYIEWE